MSEERSDDERSSDERTGAAPDGGGVPTVRAAVGAVSRGGDAPPVPVKRPAPLLPATLPVEEPEELPAMSLLEHLEELRKRLMWCVATVGVAFCVAWYYCIPIFHFLARPVYRYLPKGQKLVMLSVADGFLLYIKVAFIAAIYASAPVLLYHLWRFIQPGLYKRERRYAFWFVLSGSVLFVAGGAFAYYVAFPFAVQFLLSVGQEFTPAITGASYLRFLMTVILGLGLMFELPVVIVFLSRVGLVTPRFLMRYFRHATVIIFIIAAIITPTPDVFNLCLFAVPTLGLYLLGVAVAAILDAGTRRERARAAAAEQAAAMQAARG